MEFTSKLRWILVVFVLLFFLIFIGWGLSAIARSVFNRNSANQATVETTENTSLEGIRVARYIVDGPVVASVDHRKYVIEVSPSVVMMRVYSDYGQKVVAEKSYSNNPEAFDAFMKSLEGANATARYANTDEDDDIADTGICPDGRRFIVELGNDIRRWTTSCDRKQGTAAGKMTTMRKLFAKQIPDFDALVKNTELNRN
jgi:Na+-transporting methylmalonyl-CoA/oxaloacetate decarboxylase gamma subunit